jgi:hypothetical protein
MQLVQVEALTLEVQQPHSTPVETADLTRMIRTRIAEDLAPIKIREHQAVAHSLLGLQAPHRHLSLKKMDQTKVFQH